MNNGFTKMIENLSQNPNVKRFLADFDLLSKDLKKLQGELNKKLNTEKDQALRKAKAEYEKILARVKVAEKDLNKEVQQAITKIKKSATQVEKNLTQYRQKANAQRARAEKILKANATTKKTAPAARTRKAKTTKKTAKTAHP